MRIAVLGCGSIGKRHLRNLKAHGHHELIPYDPSPDARAHVEKLLELKPCANLDQVWERGPEIVVIAAPPNAHIPLALEAASDGAHLFIEKPLSDSLRQVDELEALVRTRGLVTMVGCNMRFHPGPALIKTLLEKGQAGAVIAARIQTGSYLPDWRPNTDYRKSYTASREQGGGAILDCIHELDLALWYFGPANVAAAIALPATKLGLEVEGLAEILLAHSSGVLSNVHLNFVQRDYRRNCQIIGENATLYWDFENSRVELRSGAGLERRFDLDSGWHVNQMYTDEMAHFLHAVERGEQTLCPLEQGSTALRLALRARELALGIPAGQGV